MYICDLCKKESYDYQILREHYKKLLKCKFICDKCDDKLRDIIVKADKEARCWAETRSDRKILEFVKEINPH